jgi:HEAT repeat protein
VRYTAAAALKDLEVPTEIYLPTLTRLISEKDDALKNSALELLSSLGRTVPNLTIALIQALVANAPASNEKIITILANLSSADKKELSALIKIAKQKKEASVKRIEAIKALGYMGQDAKKALPLLNKLTLKDDNKLIREQARRAWNSIVKNLSSVREIANPDTKRLEWEKIELAKSIQDFIQDLKSKEIERQIIALEALSDIKELGKLGALSQQMITVISHILSGETEVEKEDFWEAVDILAQSEEIKRPFIKSVLLILKITIFILGILPLIPTAAVKQKIIHGVLTIILQMPLSMKPTIGGKILLEIGSDSLPKLLKVLKSTQWEYRQKTCHILGQMSSIAMDAIPGLVQALADSYPDVAWEAKNALIKMGSPVVDQISQRLIHKF